MKPLSVLCLNYAITQWLQATVPILWAYYNYLHGAYLSVSSPIWFVYYEDNKFVKPLNPVLEPSI